MSEFLSLSECMEKYSLKDIMDKHRKNVAEKVRQNVLDAIKKTNIPTTDVLDYDVQTHCVEA